MTNLLPKLREIAVDPTKLYLDPNNPRFLTKDEDQICESRFLDLDVIEKTTERMKRKEFNYEEIKKSILANGWQPVDFIFVKKFEHENDRYVVLEGNRRVTAVKDLLSNPKTTIEIRDQITTINVMEVVDKIDKRSPKKSKRELDKKINYLLGVRHHGSLKTWSPFAQAASIFERYLSFANQEHSNFNWNDEVADKVARILNMKKKDVRERIQIFRAMTQIGEHPIVKNSEEEGGGMKSRFYSVCGAPLTMDNKAMNRYICQDPADFSLDDDTVNRFINLCNFNKKG
ncbi:hypothetical protein N9043_01220, partial [bacterium]|nr:hypothetical protein [bacterium]